jgi:hypothetical protein
MRALSGVSTGLALIALGAGGYFYLADRSTQVPPPFLVGKTDFTIDGLAPGEYEFAVTITNPANVPRSIVGVAEG